MADTELISQSIDLAAAGVQPLCDWVLEEEDGNEVLVAPFGAKVYFKRDGDAYTEVFAALSDASPQTASALPGWCVTAAQLMCEQAARSMLWTVRNDGDDIGTVFAEAADLAWRAGYSAGRADALGSARTKESALNGIMGSAIARLATLITSERDTAKGNARLIAAAPTLLAVAEELAACSEYWSEYDVPLGIVERLRAAIAVAKGEG
jgi:hypothetical protein